MVLLLKLFLSFVLDLPDSYWIVFGYGYFQSTEVSKVVPAASRTQWIIQQCLSITLFQNWNSWEGEIVLAVDHLEHSNWYLNKCGRSGLTDLNSIDYYYSKIEACLVCVKLAIKDNLDFPNSVYTFFYHLRPQIRQSQASWVHRFLWDEQKENITTPPLPLDCWFLKRSNAEWFCLWILCESDLRAFLKTLLRKQTENKLTFFHKGQESRKIFCLSVCFKAAESFPKQLFSLICNITFLGEKAIHLTDGLVGTSAEEEDFICSKELDCR